MCGNVGIWGGVIAGLEILKRNYNTTHVIVLEPSTQEITPEEFYRMISEGRLLVILEGQVLDI